MSSFSVPSVSFSLSACSSVSLQSPSNAFFAFLLSIRSFFSFTESSRASRFVLFRVSSLSIFEIDASTSAWPVSATAAISISTSSITDNKVFFAFARHSSLPTGSVEVDSVLSGAFVVSPEASPEELVLDGKKTSSRSASAPVAIGAAAAATATSHRARASSTTCVSCSPYTVLVEGAISQDDTYLVTRWFPLLHKGSESTKRGGPVSGNVSPESPLAPPSAGSSSPLSGVNASDLPPSPPAIDGTLVPSITSINKEAAGPSAPNSTKQQTRFTLQSTVFLTQRSRRDASASPKEAQTPALVARPGELSNTSQIWDTSLNTPFMSNVYPLSHPVTIESPKPSHDTSLPVSKNDDDDKRLEHPPPS